MKVYVSSRKSKILHFDGLLWSKPWTVSAKKVQKSYLSWQNDAKFKEKLTCSFKYGIRNLLNFHPTTKNENFTSMSSFVQSIKVWHKKLERNYISWHWTVIQNWINLDLVVSTLTWGIGWTFIKALKNLEICTLMGSFCPKHNVSARKFQRN